MTTTCRSTKPAPSTGGTWECSRPRGHEGRHQARDLNGTLWAQWAKRKARKQITPQVGDWATHVGGQLDPRPVAEVSADGRQIRLLIGEFTTPWISASNYTYRKAAEVAR